MLCREKGLNIKLLLAPVAPEAEIPAVRLRLLAIRFQVELLPPGVLEAEKEASPQAVRRTPEMAGQTDRMVGMSDIRQPETPEKDKEPLRESLAKQPENCIPVVVAVVKEYTEALELRELVVKEAAQKVILQLTLLPILAAAVVAGKDLLVVPAPAVKELLAARVSCASGYTKNKHGLRFGGRERRFIWQVYVVPLFVPVVSRS